MKTMTRSEFERDVSRLLDQVSGSSDSVLITSEGQPAFTVEIKPVAVIGFVDPTLPVALEDWQALR